jgi:hypothetical protein
MLRRVPRSVILTDLLLRQEMKTKVKVTEIQPGME